MQHEAAAGMSAHHCSFLLICREAQSRIRKRRVGTVLKTLRSTDLEEDLYDLQIQLYTFRKVFKFNFVPYLESQVVFCSWFLCPALIFSSKHKQLCNDFTSLSRRLVAEAHLFYSHLETHQKT